LGLGNQQAVERIVVHQRELGSLNHMTIQHRQKQRTSSEALVSSSRRISCQTSQLPNISAAKQPCNLLIHSLTESGIHMGWHESGLAAARAPGRCKPVAAVQGTNFT
jgi:hypothetical protein